MARKGNDRFNALPSDGSENERDNSGEDDDARPSRPARGGNMKVHDLALFASSSRQEGYRAADAALLLLQASLL